MTTAQISVLVGMLAFMMGVLSQAARGAFSSGKVMQKLEDLAKDIEEIKGEMKETRVWMRDNAVRNPTRR